MQFLHASANKCKWNKYILQITDKLINSLLAVSILSQRVNMIDTVSFYIATDNVPAVLQHYPVTNVISLSMTMHFSINPICSIPPNMWLFVTAKDTSLIDSLITGKGRVVSWRDISLECHEMWTLMREQLHHNVTTVCRKKNDWINVKRWNRIVSHLTFFQLGIQNIITMDFVVLKNRFETVSIIKQSKADV